MNDSFWPVSGRLQAATASDREPPFVTGSYRPKADAAVLLND